MKRILFSSILLVSALALTFNSCKKNENPDTETQSAVDNNVCEDEFTKIAPTVNNFGIKEQGVKSMLFRDRSACPMVYIDPADTLDGFPITMDLIYDTTANAVGCADANDNKIRKGKITATFSDHWLNVGSKITIRLYNYYVKGANGDELHYEVDSIVITHDAQYKMTTKVFGGKCTGPGWSLLWACSRSIEQTGGMGDTNPNNDVFQITGSANGTNRQGKTYTVNITQALVKRTSCAWIESGRSELTPQDLATRTVDFGSGNCDDEATITINGNTFTFHMN